MVRQRDELVHPLADALPPAGGRAGATTTSRHHQEGIAVGGIVTAPLQRGADRGEHGLGGVGEDQVERGGSGHAGR